MHIIHVYVVKDLLSVDRCRNSLDKVACAIYVAHVIQCDSLGVEFHISLLKQLSLGRSIMPLVNPKLPS